MAQLRAEGARRILLVTPKPLLGQWKQELYALFAIEAREAAATPEALHGGGVFLVSRDLVGSERGDAPPRVEFRMAVGAIYAAFAPRATARVRSCSCSAATSFGS